MTSRPFILAEDKYAKEFLHRLLLKAGLILKKSAIVSVGGKDKLLRELPHSVETLVRLRKATKVIIIIDGDGRPDDTREKCLNRIPRAYRQLAEVIALEWEIEEWVLKGLCMRPSGSRKPSEELSDYLRRERGATHEYDKWQLPRFAGLIDVEKLKRKDDNFSHLLSALKDP